MPRLLKAWTRMPLTKPHGGAGAWLGALALAGTLQAAPAAANVLEDIRRSGVLRVCMWPDYFGISYRHPRTGNLQGLDIDLSRALARELNVRLEYVETDFSRVLGELEARRCHIAMMGVGVTPQRAERVDFSQPYLRSDVYAVTTRSNRFLRQWTDLDQPGRVIVVQKGTLMEPLMRELLRKAELKVVEGPGDREREVESGRADAFIADYPYSRRMLAGTDWARIIETNAVVRLTSYAYAVPKGDAAWLARVNAFVGQIKQDGRLMEAARAHNLVPIVVRE